MSSSLFWDEPYFQNRVSQIAAIPPMSYYGKDVLMIIRPGISDMNILYLKNHFRGFKFGECFKKICYLMYKVP